MLSQQDSNDDIAYSYQLVVIETSAPSPICSGNCVEESDDAGFECDPQFSDCDSTDTARVYNVEPEEIPAGHYIDVEGPCTPYNQPKTLAARLEDIREAVPRVSIHFLLANDDVDTIEAVCPGVEEVLEIDEAAALYEGLLQGFDDDSSFTRLMPEKIDIPGLTRIVSMPIYRAFKVVSG